jgi:nitroimidazol reductase NimA-like FMN-containing flavoprotein (pyridoxamine 5'-phosphate oxidase superfamily)
MPDKVEQTERTRLRRYHERGHYDRATIDAILDAMPLCHVGYLIDGKPVVMPTFQWREGDHVYWHASSAGRGIRNAQDNEVCLTVSILDGLVLARSGMHHSANSRSVMIFGTARRITDPAEKLDKLKGFIEKMYPGRWDTLRPITDQEAKATAILSLPITEASAKVRSGGPVDDEEDYALPIWAGVIPVSMQIGAPVPDERNLPDVEEPAHVRGFRIG